MVLKPKEAECGPRRKDGYFCFLVALKQCISDFCDKKTWLAVNHVRKRKEREHEQDPTRNCAHGIGLNFFHQSNQSLLPYNYLSHACSGQQASVVLASLSSGPYSEVILGIGMNLGTEHRNATKFQVIIYLGFTGWNLT
jgi:hypothetical protein